MLLSVCKVIDLIIVFGALSMVHMSQLTRGAGRILQGRRKLCLAYPR